MSKRLCTIYCFKNLINEKKYIGSTIVNPKTRYNQHIYNATHENAHQYNYPLYQAIRKYGLENFEFSILIQKECEEKEIRVLEKEYIIKENSLSPKGYNQTTDTLHPINAVEPYQKMSATKRENGKEVVEINKNGEIIKKWRSVADCADDLEINEKLIGACCRGEQHSTNGKFFAWLDDNGNILNNEYVGYQYKGAKGTTQIQSTSKKVAKINLINNEILDIYDTIALAARENNCDSSSISKVCRGQRKKAAGYGWRYYEG